MLFKNRRIVISVITLILCILCTSYNNEVSGECNSCDDNYNVRSSLENIMTSDKNVKMDYRGYAEYGYYLWFNKEYKKDDKTFLYYNGEINDACKFGDIYLKYEINNKNIIQSIMVNYYYPSIKQEHKLNSIIQDKIVLQLPLEKGNKWTQKFTYNGKEYTGETTITDIYNYEGNTRYETVTKVKDIAGFKNNEYFERCIYEENKGLISFENNETSYKLNRCLNVNNNN